MMAMFTWMARRLVNTDLVPTDQSRIFLNALERAGIPTSLHIVKGGGHGFGGPEIDAKVDEFFDPKTGG